MRLKKGKVRKKLLLIYYNKYTVRDLHFFTKNPNFRDFLKIFNAFRKGKTSTTDINKMLELYFVFRKNDEDFYFATNYLFGIYINKYCLRKGYNAGKRDKLLFRYIKLCDKINEKYKNKILNHFYYSKKNKREV